MRIALTLAVAAGLAFAQNAPSLKETLKKNATAGPGAIQKEFCKTLEECLAGKLGEAAAKKLCEELKNSSLTSNDVQKLMNGMATSSQMKDWFGASRRQMPKVEQAVGEAIDEKNRCGFFGILIIVMVGDFGVDPSADFAAQAAGAKDELSPEEFKKLCSGNVSTSTIKDAFGFSSKDDCKFMQEILNAMQGSPLVQHPMFSSMGMGRGGQFDKKKFPKLGEGMPGFGAQGDEAGGLPCDLELPPCPFLTGSFEDMMKKCEKEVEAEKEKERKKKKKQSEDRGEEDK